MNYEKVLRVVKVKNSIVAWGQYKLASRALESAIENPLYVIVMRKEELEARKQFLESEKREVVWVEIEDMPGLDSAYKFLQASFVVKEAVESNRNVIVMCRTGYGRSTTTVLTALTFLTGRCYVELVKEMAEGKGRVYTVDKYMEEVEPDVYFFLPEYVPNKESVKYTKYCDSALQTLSESGTVNENYKDGTYHKLLSLFYSVIP